MRTTPITATHVEWIYVAESWELLPGAYSTNSLVAYTAHADAGDCISGVADVITLHGSDEFLL